MSISPTLGDQRVVGLAHGPIAYRDRGSGPPVVFVHGLATNGDLWRDVVPGLVANGLRCITPDWPVGAHQLPMSRTADLTPPGLAALVAEFMDVLELRQVTLVGNDTGGAVCQLVATQHPSRLGRLVLASCDAYETFPPRPFGYLKWLGKIPGGLFITSRAMRSTRVRKLPLAYGRVMRQAPPRDVSDSYTRAGYESAAIRRDTAKVLAGLSNAHTKRAAKDFGSVSAPVFVAWAGNDELFPRSLAHRLFDAFPNSELRIIEGSRTFIGEDEPEALASTIREFIAAHPVEFAGRTSADEVQES